MPHILHTVWLDSHEPTNKDTLWIKPLKKDYYGIFVYGSNGWVLTTALFKGTIGEFVIDQLPEATIETNGVMAAQDKRDLEMLKDALANIDVIIEAINNIDQTPTEGSQHMITSGGVYESLEGKVDAVAGKRLSTEDFTSEEKNKLASIPDDVVNGIQSDWNTNNNDSVSYIKNRTHWEENGVVHKLHPKFLDMDTTPTSGSTKPVTSGGVKAAIADFVTRAVNDLLNYYKKTEIYTKAEVNQLVAGINNWEIVPVAQLPEASADTMHKIYLVPSSNPETRNVKDEFITIEVSGAYSWEQIGTTAIDLTNYVTKQDLSAALADYVTSTAFMQALALKQDVIEDLPAIRQGASLGATAYQKPSTGIPKTDMSTEVQETLDLADLALQYTPSGEIDPKVTPADFATREELSQLRSEINGVITETVTVTGYHDKYGSYDFKRGVKYRITISTTDAVTLYYSIVDSDGNQITTSRSTSQFPLSFDFVPALDYVGAQFALGNANTHNYEINIEYEALKGKVDRLDSSVGSEVLYSKVHTGTSINAQLNVTPGSVYKLVLETNATIVVYLNSATKFQFRMAVNSGTYYIPVFDDGGSPYINLRKLTGDEFQLTYTLSRLKAADFIANIKSPVNYVKVLSDTLAFRWVQGFWTTKTVHNTNNTWCNTEIQYNRGAQIRVTFSDEYYVVKRTVVFGTGQCVDNGQITSGDTFDTTNWGPWIIGVRRVDRSPITPEQAAAAVTITLIGGEVYSMPFGADDVRQMIDDAARDIPAPVMTINPRLGTNEIGRFMHHMNVESNSSIIPSQSLFDIAYAKALGFRSIEANVHTCSDGVAVIKHGNAGKLGAGLLFASGSGIDADTLFSAVTSTALRQNVTYNSPLAKYQGHIPTLDEFCAECARLDMIPFLRGANTAQLNIARKYLPDEKIIVEGPASRGDFKGMMTYYGTGTKAAILATCAAKGMPFYFSWSAITTTAEADVADVIQTLHTNGYLIGGAYLNQNDYQRLAGLGLDIDVSSFNNIPPFENGNKLNILRGDDSNLEMTNASYESATQTIAMQNGGKIAINNSEIGAALSKICVKIRYSGTLDIIFIANDSYGNLLAYQSDGEKEIVLAVSSQKVGTKIMEIAAQSVVTIYDIKVFASIVF